VAWTEVESGSSAGTGSPIHGAQGATLASAATVALTDSYHVISGTTQVNTFTFSGAPQGMVVIRPSGAFPIGTSGNILHAPASATVDRHMLFWYDGTSFYFVGAITGALTQSGQLGCRTTASAAQAIPSATLTSLTWDTEAFDVGGVHSTSTNSSRFTVPAGGAGRWRLAMVTSFAASNSGYRDIYIRKNGTTNLTVARVTNPGVSVGPAMHLTITDVAADGDYYEFAVYQNTGGALNANDNTTLNYGEAIRLG
jgi:hypothetical protein